MTLRQPLSFSFKEKDSAFFISAWPLRAGEAFKPYLTQAAKDNPQARHILYVTRSGENIEQAQEDKEPVGSMHRALSLARQKNITDFIIIIVRYFGGTLLGASHLDGIYFSLAMKALSEANLTEDLPVLGYKGEMASFRFAAFKEKMAESGGQIIKADFNGGQVSVEFKSRLDKSALSEWFKRLDLIS